MLFAIILLYIFGFGMLFMALEKKEEEEENWTVIDGWYFAVVTIGTVGYGEITPTNDTTRGMIVVFLAGGMAFFVFTMTILCEMMLDKMEDVTSKYNLAQFTCCGVRVLGLVILLTLIVTSGVCYGVFVEKWNFVNSIYFTVVTITTVGYGDLVPTTQGGRVAISIYILLAGGCFGAILSGVIANYMIIRHRSAALMFMVGALTKEKIQMMPKNGNGETGLPEFRKFMITRLGYMREEDLNMIDDCFAALDIDNSGCLTEADIVNGIEGPLFLDVMRSRHGIKAGDETKLPLGLFGIRFKFVQGTDPDDEKFKTRLKRAHADAHRTPGAVKDEEGAVSGAAGAIIEGFKPNKQDIDELLDDLSPTRTDHSPDGSMSPGKSGNGKTE